jgi:hypothetical protein
MVTLRNGEKQGSVLTGQHLGVGPGEHDGIEAH